MCLPAGWCTGPHVPSRSELALRQRADVLVKRVLASQLARLQSPVLLLWGMLERKSNKVSHPTVESVRAAIDEAVANLDLQHLVNACVRFRCRLEAVL